MSKLKTHGRDLQNVFLFSSSIKIADGDKLLSDAVDCCHAFIKADVNTPFPVIQYFLESKNWGNSDEVKELFTDYVKNGFINLDEPMSNGALPLEMAIIKGNLGLFEALIENGSDITRVPTGKKNYGFIIVEVVDDIHEFIEAYHDGPTALAFATKLKESIMRRQIILSAQESESSMRLPARPRRRLGAL